MVLYAAFMRNVLILAAVGASISLLYACGSDSSSTEPGADGGGVDATTDAPTRSDSGSSHPDASTHDAAPDADAGPVAAPFGLDARPSNTTCLAQKRPVPRTGVALQQVWSSLNLGAPIYLTQAPGDNDRWFAVDILGTVRVFPTAAVTQAEVSTFVKIPVAFGGEAGLLGMAFHPDWQANHEVYLSYTRDKVAGDLPSPDACFLNGATVFTSAVSRFHSKDGGLTLDPTPDEIVTLSQPYFNHNGGNIQFSPVDRMLYIGFGDGGAGNDPCGSGQDLSSLLGKIIRIDVNAGPGKYNIPKDNPFFGSATTRSEIWAYGFRNPWRWSFDRVAGDLWAGDVGQSAWEEIDHVIPGGNYGWNACEGNHALGSTVIPCTTPGFQAAVAEHGRDEAQAIVGGYVYRGSAMPSLVGTYIYGDFVTGNIWALTYDASNKPTPVIIASITPNQLVSFAEGNDGELYTVEFIGTISKLVPQMPAPPDPFPALLSQTGCVDPKDATRPAPGVLAYDVVSPLWSDGAKKDRFFAIPDGKQITVGADGDWDLPIGSVTMKTFSMGGKRVETRLFMRHDDGGWAGYTYEWNDQQTDATLLPGGKVKLVNGGTQRYTFPSRSQCMQCHSAATGGTIGLEIAQLNRSAIYPSTNRVSNELATLDHIGMFSAPLGNPSMLASLPDPAGADPVQQRARSYLHANCAHCHRPGGSGQGTMDLRYGTPFVGTGTCNAATTQGAVSGASTILVPGDAGASVLSLRFRSTTAPRMPPLAVSVTDPAGAALLDQWITGVKTCP
jgi:uncharacterized repeat protein (TIGR03806 family)